MQDSGWLFDVLLYCDDHTRKNCLFLCKRYNQLLTTESAFKWRLERLHVENGIFFPPILPPKEKSWKELFLDLYKRRHLWRPKLYKRVKDQHDNFKIEVSVRFKPDDVNRLQSQSVTLPLHQKLALIKMNSNATSNKEALKILTHRGEWFKEKWCGVEPHRADPKYDEKKKAEEGLKCGLHGLDEGVGRVLMIDPTKGLREYEFDNVFSASSSQGAVYDASLRRLVCDFLNGYNGTCLMYGQTGSGKTYTAFGPHDMNSSQLNLQGLFPRACSEILDAIDFRKRNLNIDIEATMGVSYIELFGDEVSDLLQKGQLCGHSRVTAHKYVLSGASEQKVETTQDVIRLLEKGEKQKRKASTAMNVRSSRAHSIFIITLHQKCINSGVSTKNRLFLADLGGSEQTKKSDIIAGSMRCSSENNTMTSSREPIAVNNSRPSPNSVGFVKSDRMREAVHINLGLMALKNCVRAITSKQAHIPYSQSKLTVMLSSGLGGDSKTHIVVCAAQDEQHASETIQTLNFGMACRNIHKKARNGAEMLVNAVAKIDTDIAECEARIQKNERWEVREQTRVESSKHRPYHVGNLMHDALEVKKTTVLVGAEEDCKLLHELLKKRAGLTGVNFHAGMYGNKDKGVVGFGNAHVYGMGQKADVNSSESSRFDKHVSIEEIPYIMGSKGQTRGWNSDELDSTRNAETKCSADVYSGLSA